MEWGGTYGKNDECPLLDELGLIFSAGLSNFAILIDDARLFLAPPPYPHAINAWPTIIEVTKTLPAGWDMIIFDDVIFITPEDINFREYMQKKITNMYNYKNRSRWHTQTRKFLKKLFSF